MGKTASLGWVLAFLLSASGVRGEEDGLDAAWVAKDRAVVARLAKALPPGDRPAAAWRSALGDADAREDRAVVGDGRRLELALYGGYTTTWVRALVLGDRVVELRVDCPLDEGEIELGVAAALRESWAQVAGSTEDAGWHHAWADPKRRAAYRAEVEKAFGARPEPAVPADLRAAFTLLDGALSPLHYGRTCYEAGRAPRGREALETLVRSRATAVLGALLRSPNPEGRLYASEGLLRLEGSGEALTEGDRNAIRSVRASPLPILYCSGCEVGQGPATEALAAVGEPAKGG